MAAVTWEDFLKHMGPFRNLTDAKATLLNKALVCMYGILSIGLGFAAGPMGGIINAAVSMQGSLAGPLVGLFFLGVCVPKAHKHAAIIACILGIAVSTWITLGSVIEQPFSGYNIGFNSNYCEATANHSEKPGFDRRYGNPNVFVLYRISSFLFSLIGLVIVFVVGTILSYVIPHRTRTRSTFATNESHREQSDTLQLEEDLCSKTRF